MAIWSKDKEETSEKADSGSPEPMADEYAIGEMDNADGLQRHLGNRQIQLIAIGGSIGTALFVTIGKGLFYGGPGSLLIGYTLYSCIVAMVNNGLAEMSVKHPVSGGFIRLAGYWVDDALGFMAGWNFFFYEALLIPFEITALIAVISYWSPEVLTPGITAAICVGCIICYAAINILAVKAYGEAEFWLSGGKVILIFMLFFFTFITMVGGNPEGDAYGFRYWEGDKAFKEWISTGSTGRFEGFLAALYSAAFTVVGPEYMSMVAAEAKRPRIYIKTAFKTVYFRFGLFFIGGALAVGIVCNSTWQDLQEAAIGDKGAGTAAASPYVIAMKHLNVKIFNHFVNALMMTSIFSAGNTYTYCAVRNLYGLSLEGRAPRFLSYTTRKGVPLWCFCIVMVFPFLSFLSVSSGSSTALTWLVSLTTAGGLIDYIVVTITYLRFYKACQVQGVDRKTFPYYGYFQPYTTWIALTAEVIIVITFGYAAFRDPSGFDATYFFSSYVLVLVDPFLYIGWKLLKRTKVVKPEEVDLVWESRTIDAYEETFIDPPVGFWRELIQLFGLWKVKGGNDKRRPSAAVDMDEKR